ncbi:hypothetical protein A2U01_0044188 [Trifolium medium]|uniref:Uncharacterized protein n=1 Tax=Trifolium medium TaxID=97028 RepID=A0A392QGZ4_9FABA|nr:hypothetical protein [Trifolium medium]
MALVHLPAKGIVCLVLEPEAIVVDLKFSQRKGLGFVIRNSGNPKNFCELEYGKRSEAKVMEKSLRIGVEF